MAACNAGNSSTEPPTYAASCLKGLEQHLLEELGSSCELVATCDSTVFFRSALSAQEIYAQHASYRVLKTLFSVLFWLPTPKSEAGSKDAEDGDNTEEVQAIEHRLDLQAMLKTHESRLQEFPASTRFKLDASQDDALLAREASEALATLGWKRDARDATLSLRIRRIEETGHSALLLKETDARQAAEQEHVRGLDSSLCLVMAKLAKIELGDVVLDPMAGTGSCLKVAAAVSPPAMFIGGDNSKAQLKLMSASLTACPLAEMMISSVKAFPVNDDAVDVVIADLPFGNRHGSAKQNKYLYRHVVLLLLRCVRPRGRCVLLTSRGQANRLIATITKCNLMHTERKRLLLGHVLDVSLGQTQAVVFLGHVLLKSEGMQADMELGTCHADICARYAEQVMTQEKRGRAQQRGSGRPRGKSAKTSWKKSINSQKEN